MLDECDLGHRVVVRRYLARAGHRTDVLGELISIDAGGVVVRLDTGIEVEIPLVEIEAAKRIPPRRPRYSEIAALEVVADQAWPAPVVDRLGDWRLRSADGWTTRANSALPLGQADRPLAEAIDACVRWYADRSQPPMITVPLPLQRDVADALRERGWTARPTVLVQVAAVAEIIERAAEGPVELSAIPSPDFLVALGARKAPPPLSGLSILIGAPQVRFAEVREPTGALLASARAAVVSDWMHLGLVGVAEAARRQGLAQRVTGALARWAAGAGAGRAVLQVEEHNLAAVRLYERLAFRTHHTYVTYVAPSSLI